MFAGPVFAGLVFAVLDDGWWGRFSSLLSADE